jgi:hypothetical protein
MKLLSKKKKMRPRTSTANLKQPERAAAAAFFVPVIPALKSRLRLIPLASGIARLRRARPALCQWARFLQSRQGPLARPLLCFQPSRAILITHKPHDPAQATPTDSDSESDERAASRYANLQSYQPRCSARRWHVPYRALRGNVRHTCGDRPFWRAPLPLN